MEQTINIFRKTISPIFPIIVQMVAVVALLFNLYLASKLSPLVQDLSLLRQQVSANEAAAASERVAIDARFIQLQADANAKYSTIQSDLNTIKGYFIQRAIQNEN